MRRARGFTLAEVLVALTLTGIIGAVAVPFFVKQMRSVVVTAGNLDSQQSASFALNTLDHDLRIAGVGTSTNQPQLIEASRYEVGFNSNLVTSDSTDTTSLLTAGYYDPSVAAAQTTSLDSTQAISMPLTPLLTGSTNYPKLDYYQSSGLKSVAQTIIYYFATDTSSGAIPTTYALWRKVNTGTPTLLARGLDTSSKFQYLLPATYLSAADSLEVDSIVPVGWRSFPWYFSYAAGNTLTSADTLLSAISQISVQLKAVYQDEFGHRHYRSVSEAVPLLNSGLSHIAGCGAAPGAPATFAATARPAGDSVHLHWSRSPDEGGGQNDVQDYVVYRRAEPSTTWSAVITVPTGASDTSAVDTGLPGSGQKYDYALAAEDCTPSMSSITSTTVTGVTPLP